MPVALGILLLFSASGIISYPYFSMEFRKLLALVGAMTLIAACTPATTDETEDEMMDDTMEDTMMDDDAMDGDDDAMMDDGGDSMMMDDSASSEEAMEEDAAAEGEVEVDVAY